MPQQKKDGAGPIVAIIIIVIVLGLGGLYYLTEEISRIRSGGGVTTTEVL